MCPKGSTSWLWPFLDFFFFFWILYVLILFDCFLVLLGVCSNKTDKQNIGNGKYKGDKYLTPGNIMDVTLCTSLHCNFSIFQISFDYHQYFADNVGLLGNKKKFGVGGAGEGVEWEGGGGGGGNSITIPCQVALVHTKFLLLAYQPFHPWVSETYSPISEFGHILLQIGVSVTNE